MSDKDDEYKLTWVDVLTHKMLSDKGVKKRGFAVENLWVHWVSHKKAQ